MHITALVFFWHGSELLPGSGTHLDHTHKKKKRRVASPKDSILSVFSSVSDSEDCGLLWAAATFQWMMDCTSPIYREEEESGHIYVTEDHSWARKLVQSSHGGLEGALYSHRKWYNSCRHTFTMEYLSAYQRDHLKLMVFWSIYKKAILSTSCYVGLIRWKLLRICWDDNSSHTFPFCSGTSHWN